MIGFVIFLFITGMVVWLVAKYLPNAIGADQTARKLAAFISPCAFWSAVLLPAAIVGCASINTVPQGNVGIVSVFGKISETPLYPGLNIINPLSRVDNISIQIERYKDKTYHSASKDMQIVLVEMELNYSLLPEYVPQLMNETGRDFADKIIAMAAHEVLKANTAMYNAFEILQLRHKIKEDIQSQLRTWLSKYGIELREVAIVNISFGPEYTHAIEQKQIQEQLAEQKRYELVRTQREAEIATAKAKGEADALRESAKAKADALRIEGEAQAEYNRKVAESITQALLNSQYLKRWDGRLPMYQLGSDSRMLLQLPSIPVKE